MAAVNEQEEFEFRYRMEQEQAAQKTAAPALSASPTSTAASPDKQGDASSPMHFIAQNLDKGIANLVGLPADTSANVIDLAKMAYGVASHELTGATPPDLIDRSKVMSTGEGIQNWMRKIGLLDERGDPTSGAGRIAASALQALPSGVVGGDTAIPAVASRTAGAAASGAASQTAAEAGGGPGAQIIAGMLPSGVRPGIAAGKEKIRQGIIGKEDIQKNIDLQRRAGVTNPDPAVVANNKGLAQAETTVSRLPGSGGLIEKADEQRAMEISKKVEEIARTLAPSGPVSAERAGRYITSGVSDAVDGLQARQNALYQKFDQTVPQQHPIQMKNFLKALNDYKQTTPGFSRTSKSLKDPAVLKIIEDIETDLRGQRPTLLNQHGQPIVTAMPDLAPYQIVSKLRSEIGKNLTKSILIPDSTTQFYKKMYATLSDDIRGSLPAKSKHAWDRANHFSRGMHERIEKVYQPLMDKGTPEKALKAAFSGTKDGSSAFRKIMGSLNPDQRNAVASHVVENMGTAPSHMQDASGKRFSMEHFLTQWDKLKAPGVREALYSSPKTRADISTIAEAIAQQRAVRAGTYNPSGTAKAYTHASVYTAAATEIAMSLLHGNIGSAAAGAGALATQMAASRYAARAMTSPEFIKWMAEGTKIKPADLPAHLARLTVIANNTRDPETKQVLQEYAEQVKQ